MKAWQWCGAGLGLFGLSLLLTVPATLVRKALPAGLTVGHLDGTLWRGQADDVRWQGEVLSDQLRWNWQLLQLLRLRLTFDLSTRWQGRDGAGRISIGSGHIDLSNAELPLPLDPLAAAIPDLAQYQLRGTLVMSTRAFAWSDGRGDGELAVLWQDARSDYSADAVMGTYRIDLKAAAKGYAVKVQTQDGVLKIDGEGTGAPGQGWSVGAVVAAPAEQLPRFQPLLARLGPPNPDGRYHLRYSFK